MNARTVLLGLGATLVGCGSRSVAERPNPIAAPKAEARPEPKVASVPDDPQRLRNEILKRVKAATVLIGNFEKGKLNSTGSGVVLSDGRTVVTNRHVVVGDDDDPDPLKLVFFSGTDRARIVEIRSSAITLLATKSKTAKDYDEDDIAAIRLPVQIAAPLDVAKEASMEETASAWGIGFPNGIEIRRSDGTLPAPTVHTMRIERVERVGGQATVLQFGGSATYGDSGGPIVTDEGEVLGLMQALADGRSSIVYAIPARTIRTMIARERTPAPRAGTLASRFAADFGGKEVPTPRPPAPARPKAPSDPGPIRGATSVLAEQDVDEEMMESLSPVALTLLRNEPFARRGYIFRRAALRRAFSAQGWYTPRTRDMAAVERLFTSRERRNVNRIGAYQNATGKTW